MLKNTLLISILIFLYSAPHVAKAELSPENNYKLECEQAFSGEIINVDDVKKCKLPNGKLCTTKLVSSYEKYQSYPDCDFLMNRKCSKLGENTRYGQECCDNLVEIKEKRSF